MSLFSADTRPETARILLAGYRSMTPAQKLARVADLSLACQQIAEARIRRQYPGADEREIRVRVGALTLGKDLVRRVCGWDPEREGW